MAFIFTCGTHTFNHLLEGYENLTARCQNCGNFSAHVYSRWSWFTFCFIPVVPLGGRHHEVGCHICNFYQDLGNRPDVQQQMSGGGGASQQIPMNPYDNQGAGRGPYGPQQGNPVYQPPRDAGKPSYA